MEEGLELEEAAVVVKFNPWMFSGTEPANCHAFFHELGAQVRETGDKKFDKIATAVDQYSFLFSPLTLIPGAGGYVSRAARLRQRRQEMSMSQAARAARPLNAV